MNQPGADLVFYNMDTIPELRTKTDKNGRYVLKNIPVRANLKLEVKAAGFAKSYHKNYREYFFPGTKNNTITLEPESSIKGRVIYADSGKPARGIEVRAACLDNLIPYSDYVTTDKQGNFELPNLVSGVHHVALVNDIRLPEWTAYPVEDIYVESGKTVENIELQLIKGGIVKGRVTVSDTDKPVSGIQVSTYHTKISSRISFGTDFTDNNGEYRSRSVPGDVKVVTYSKAEYIKERPDNVVEVQEGKTIDGINFHLKKGFVVHGKVFSPDGEPVSGVVITIDIFNAWRNSFVSDENGSFTLGCLKDGEGKIRVI